ncbi:hypothetical protein HID58_066300 [Brassica napus]|uniref:Replication factor A C-terminal domain-containing protein n=1 Tax=Brassica napus TaxID=3708 RepID=A0ABQ7ZFC9_BRANA|nr:hypothetical protein HID58_066300 [Brassica napus]
METKGNSSIFSDRKTNKKTVASSATARANGKSTASYAIVMKPNGKSAVSSAILMKPNASTALSFAHGDQVMFFRNVSLRPHEADLRFRLIHFWEARNPNTKILIGQEMLLIDEEGTVIQGFVPAGRVGTYKLTPGSVYKLSNFFGSKNKAQYRVTDHSATVTFAWNSDLSALENPLVPIHEDRFKFHSYEEFQANCDRKVDLYDYVGHMKLVNGQTITGHTVLDKVDIAEKRHLCVHVQTHDAPVMKLYLWDKAASDFCQKFKSYGSTPSVLLVTTVTPKHLGVFMDTDVQPSKDYLGWKLLRYMSCSVAWFECTATIDDVVQGSAWYYISCDECNSKAVKGLTSLICNNKKCGKSEVTGVAQYLTRISVYDKSEQAVLSFLSNEGVGADHCMSVPHALLDTIGQTHKFIVKVSDHNLTGKTQTITVTKILPPEAPHPIAPLEEDAIPVTSDDILKTGSEESGPSRGFEDSAGDRVRKASESLESNEAKHSKSG